MHFSLEQGSLPFSPLFTSVSPSGTFPSSHTPQHQEPFLSKITFFVGQVSGLWGWGGRAKGAIIAGSPDV